MEHGHWPISGQSDVNLYLPTTSNSSNKYIYIRSASALQNASNDTHVVDTTINFNGVNVNTASEMHVNALPSLPHPCMAGILSLYTLYVSQYLYDPGILPGCANQCLLYLVT